MWQNVAKWNELLKLPRRQISLVAKELSCRNFRKGKFHGLLKLPKKGKFQVNLNKGLYLLFRAEPGSKPECPVFQFQFNCCFNSIQLNSIQFSSIQLSL